MMLFVIVIAILITPFALEWRRIPMDAQARADAPGDFAPLSNGITHYKFYGPVDGPLVVCVHGLTTPAFVYEGLAKRLVKRGYRHPLIWLGIRWADGLLPPTLQSILR